MASTLPDIIGIEMPFAANGSRSNIPAQQSVPGDGNASLNIGFPPETSLPLESGGIPPGRGDFNAALYLATLPLFRLQQGGYYTFSEDVSGKIGGYPQGAILYYLDNSTNPAKYKFLMSAKTNNTDNFVTTPSFIGTSWIDVTPYADDFLPLAGGTMRGTINFSNNTDQEILVDSNGDLMLGDNDNSAVIRLRGANSTYPGVFYIRAKNANTESYLICYPDGTMTWRGRDITLGHPNYAAAVQSSFSSPGTAGTSYTAPSGGFVAVIRTTASGDGYLTVNINNVPVYDATANTTNKTSSGFYPVSKGDIVTVTANSAGYFLFVPNK